MFAEIINGKSQLLANLKLEHRAVDPARTVDQRQRFPMPPPSTGP